MAYIFSNTSSQYLTATLTEAITYPLTLAAWFNCPGSTGANQSIISVANTVSGDRFQLVLGLGAPQPQLIQVAVIQGATQPAAWTSSTFSYNTWNHTAAVLPSSTSRIPYLNGVTSGTVQTTACIPSQANVVAIGARFASSYGLFANASIGEVGIWSTNLMQSEITSLSRGVTPQMIRPQSLVFYAPLVRNLVDVRGGRLLTNTNTAAVTNHPRIYV